MKRIIVSLALLALAVPVLAEEDSDYDAADVVIGLWQKNPSNTSSKFLEYRDIPQGAVAPLFRFHGKKGDYRYDIQGYDVTQDDQRYLAKFEGSSWRLDAAYVGIPHRFGNGGKSILNPISDYEWRISDTIQQAFQNAVVPAQGRIDYNCQPRPGFNPPANCFSLLNLVTPTLDGQPSTVDMKLQRDRTNLAFTLMPAERNFNIGVTYFHERRSGTRTANGTSFGFGNVVETPEPIRFITQDFGVNASLKGDWGNAFFGFNFNDFSDKFDAFTFDNPFRNVDSTDASAYQSPSNSSVNGPRFGVAGTPPSNEAWTIKGGTTLKLGSRTRLTADLQVGQWTQNEQPFIPWTTNTAIRTPSGALATTAPLPATSLDGKIDVLALNGFFTTRVTDNLRLNARYRYYENENKTPRIEFHDGYVRFDAVWEDIPRITVPNGFDSSLFDVYGTFDVGRVGFEAGWKYNKIARTFRETEHTTENTLRVAADLRFGAGVLLRGMYEFGTRDFDHYDAIEAEEHSFLEAGAPANQTVLRRFDQAKRDRNRFGGTLQFAPESGKFTLAASYFWNQDKYDDAAVPCDGLEFLPASERVFCAGGTAAPLGLQEAEYKTFSVDADISPNDRITFYGFYSREDIFDFQTGRQSAATVTFNPAFNWSSTVDDKVDTLGAGAKFALVPDKWDLDLFYRYQKVDGNNDFTAGPSLTTATNPFQDIPAYDDTKLAFFSAQLKYSFAKAWAVAFGGFYEDYEVTDSQDSILNYMPASFFLNANRGSYDAWVGWINLSYRFN
jgi:hypothetical protein